MVEQPKVTTRSMSKRSKVAKILKALRNYPEGATPKMIAWNSALNINTVKSLLPQIKDVKKLMRGYYSVVERGDTPINEVHNELRDWNFHNCILSCQLKDYPGKTISTTISLRLINLEFVISKKGKCTIRVIADNPLNVSSLCMVYGYMLELIARYSKDAPQMEDLVINTIEFNKTYTNLRLDGVKSLMFGNLIEQFKVYQKSIGMRVEHKMLVPIAADTVVAMLTNTPNTLELTDKVDNLQKGIEVSNRLMQQYLEVRK